MSCRVVTTTQGWMIAYNLKDVDFSRNVAGCIDHGEHTADFCSQCGKPSVRFDKDETWNMSVYDLAEHMHYPNDTELQQNHAMHPIMSKGWPIQPNCEVDIRGKTQLFASNDCEIYGQDDEDSVKTHYGESSRKLSLTKEQFTEHYADLIKSMEAHFGPVIVVFMTTVTIDY